MLKVKSITNFQHHQLESIRVLDDYQTIQVFFTTKSVENQFGITITQPDGYLDDLPVIGIQTLFNLTEDQQPEISEALSKTVDYQRQQITIGGINLTGYYFGSEQTLGIPWEELRPHLTKPNRSVMINILKSVAFTLDDTPVLSVGNASALLKKYHRPTKPTTNKTTKGFAKP